jgi:hypothetical protein
MSDDHLFTSQRQFALPKVPSFHSIIHVLASLRVCHAIPSAKDMAVSAPVLFKVYKIKYSQVQKPLLIVHPSSLCMTFVTRRQVRFGPELKVLIIFSSMIQVPFSKNAGPKP